MHSRRNNGVILATTISVVVAGDISNCSTVPRLAFLDHRRRAISEPFKINSTPKIPVTITTP